MPGFRFAGLPRQLIAKRPAFGPVSRVPTKPITFVYGSSSSKLK